MTRRVEFLTNTPYFANLTTAELEAVDRYIFEKEVDKGKVILMEGEPAPALYFVVSGRVKLYKTSLDGKEQVFNFIQPGESFHDIPLFDRGPNPASAEAVEPTLLYGIRRADMMKIIANYPIVAANVIRVLARKSRHLVTLVEDLSFRNVLGRLAKVLVEYSGDEPEGTEGVPLRQRLTQQEMAAIVGTSREVIGRSLKALESAGAIRMDHRRVLILDRKILRRIS